MRQDRAGKRADAIPDDVVDVRNAVGEKVLPRLDEARERHAEKHRQHVRLDRRPLQRVERDEQQKSERYEQEKVHDDRHDDQRDHAHRHGMMLDPPREMTHVLERNRVE